MQALELGQMSKREKKNIEKRRNAKSRKADRASKSTERSVQILYSPDLKGVAKWFGIAYQTAKEWKRNGAPERTKGGYDIHAWTLWKVHRAPARSEEELRIKRARADLLEHNVAKAKGGTVDAAEAKRARLRIIDTFTGLMDQAAGELAPLLPGKKGVVMRIIDDWQRERRNRLVKEHRG